MVFLIHKQYIHLITDLKKSVWMQFLINFINFSDIPKY